MWSNLGKASQTIEGSSMKHAVGGRPPRYGPLRPATEARSSWISLYAPSQPASHTHRPPTGCTRHTSDTDVRQHHRLMPPGQGYNK